MRTCEEIKEMIRDNVLLGKKAIVCDIKIEILKRGVNEISTKELFEILDRIIEKEEFKRGETK